MDSVRNLAAAMPERAAEEARGAIQNLAALMVPKIDAFAFQDETR